MLGKEGAMACTVAVETVIGEHYDRYVCFYSMMYMLAIISFYCTVVC